MADSITLGALETAVMQHLWDVKQADVKMVWSVVGRGRQVTHNTVQSTMDRLFRKGLLDRAKVSHAFVYQPSLTQAAFRARVVKRAAESVSDAENDMLAAFVDIAAEVGEDTLAKLEALIAQKRRMERDS